MAKKWYKFDKEHSEIEDIVEGKGWEHYVWGEVTYVHRVGEYAILEYISDFGKDVGKVYFHPFIWTEQWHNEEFYWSDKSTSYRSLDSALIGAIARKIDGTNSQAAEYFGKMIGLDQDK